jgi:ATP adenylyltransferase
VTDRDERHEEQRGAGLRDAFARLWTPHRMAYIKGEGKGPDCAFCDIPGLDDREGLVVARGTTSYAVLNLYPYNSGHLMIVPFRHVADYDELTAEETAEVAAMTQHAIRAIRHASAAQGFNVGMNLGHEAGAGIAAHLHQHVVPGDARPARPRLVRGLSPGSARGGPRRRRPWAPGSTASARAAGRCG